MFIVTVFSCMTLLSYIFAFEISVCIPVSHDQMFINTRPMLAVGLDDADYEKD